MPKVPMPTEQTRVGRGGLGDSIGCASGNILPLRLVMK